MFTLEFSVFLLTIFSYWELGGDNWCYCKIGELYYLSRDFGSALIYLDLFIQSNPKVELRFLRALIEDCIDEFENPDEENENSDEEDPLYIEN